MGIIFCLYSKLKRTDQLLIPDIYMLSFSLFSKKVNLHKIATLICVNHVGKNIPRNKT